MIVWGWLFIGLVATIFLRSTLYTADDNIAILSGLISAGSWGMFAYQSLSVEFTDGAQAVTRSYPAVTFFAAGLGLVGIYIALTGPIGLIGEQVSDVTSGQQPRQQR